MKDKALGKTVSECLVGPIALTDHVAVQLNLVLESDRAKKNRWRMTISSFQDPHFNKLITEEFDKFSG